MLLFLEKHVLDLRLYCVVSSSVVFFCNIFLCKKTKYAHVS